MMPSRPSNRSKDARDPLAWARQCGGHKISAAHAYPVADGPELRKEKGASPCESTLITIVLSQPRLFSLFDFGVSLRKAFWHGWAEGGMERNGAPASRTGLECAREGLARALSWPSGAAQRALSDAARGVAVTLAPLACLMLANRPLLGLLQEVPRLY